MTLAMPVMHPHRPDTVLLRPGFVLDGETIERLGALRLGDLWVRYPGLEVVERFVSPRILKRRGMVAARVREVVESFAVDAHAPLPYGRFADTVKSFIEAIFENTTAAVMIQSMSEGDERLSRHAADVCLLSLLLGMKLEDYLISERQRVPGRRAKSIVGIGIAAMVADVGVLELPEEALKVWAANGADESDPFWHQHVALGHARVREGIGPASAAAVLHHHQRFDGTGFPSMAMGEVNPRPLRGREIHIFARIVGAADLFWRMRRPMSSVDGASSVPTVCVLRQLLSGHQSKWIDPVVRRAMLAVVPAFAPGQVVRLNTGDQGVVVGWDPGAPCRPTVRIVDERLETPRTDAVEIDLRTHKKVTIVEVEGTDVTGDQFELRGGGHIDVPDSAVAA